MYLADISGVTGVDVNLEQSTAEIISDRKITVDDVNAVLKESHYKAYE
ncbi:heavy-metal-associated domain-containing protein [Candidatus Microgenomates bacterium]|nr:heavy-metal-associated domain-containing protein [Candidatus Microgenomates bacterium]